MANFLCKVLLTDEALVTPKAVVDSAAGAIVEFRGAVRGREDGREIEGIDYEAHRLMAEHQLRTVAKEAVERFQLRRVIVHHRVGFVPAGEASLFLRVTAPHRSAAFEASEWIVNELKEKVPIWKRPKFKAHGRGCPTQSEPATAK